jgi:glycine/D-amino acid oxidase-like deaminating enzyme
MTTSVAVIGAGVVGASIAYQLARAGARVTLIDRRDPGSGTSATSFAWVNANDKPPLAYYRLNAESMVAHRRLRDDVARVLADRAEDPAPNWLHETGGLEWTDTDAGRSRLMDKVARLRAWNYHIDVLDLGQVHTLEPNLRLDGLTAATFAPDEAWVDAPLFCATVARAAATHGAIIRTGVEVVGLERSGDRIAGVQLASGERVTADHTVIAAGRWSDRVAALAGIVVPLAPTYGLLAVTSPVAEGVGRAVHVPGMNFRPDPSGGLVLQSGATDATVIPETPPDPALPACADLLQRIQRFLPATAGAEIVEARIGIRPMPADGYSIAGPIKECPGLYLAVTHSGVTLAPLLGEIVAQEITTGQDDPRLTTFRPGRWATGS